MATSPAAYDRRALVAIALGALVGTAWLAYVTVPRGVGLNQLALHHMTAAECLRHGEPMTLSRGQAFALYPPLLPVLLALGRSAGLDYPTVGLVMNLATYAATLFLSSLLLLRLFGSTWIAITSQLLLILSPELLITWRNLHTEPISFVLVTGGLYLFAVYLERPTRLRLSAIALIALLACLQRYVNVAFAFALFLLTLGYPRTLPRRTRFVRAIALSFVALAPLGLWLLRTWLVGAQLGGPLTPRPLNETVITTWQAIAGFLVPGSAIDEPIGILIIALGLALVGLALGRLLPDRPEEERRALIVFLVFPVILVVELIAISVYMRLDAISDRYVIPVYPFLWATALLGFAELRRRTAGHRAWIRNGLSVAFLAVFGGHLVHAVVQSRELGLYHRENGVGWYSTPAWPDSSLARWLRSNRLEGEVYSNFPEAVLVASGRRAKFADPESLPALVESSLSDTHVVWIDHGPDMSPLPELRGRSRRLECVARVQIGTLYSGGVYRVDTGP